jgi:hypothetical protein
MNTRPLLSGTPQRGVFREFADEGEQADLE